MDAAHIIPKQHGGECISSNGLSLCPTHHRAFDWGIWTIDKNFKVLISPKVILNKQDDTIFTPYEKK